jgi:hypothetical protein
LIFANVVTVINEVASASLGIGCGYLENTASSLSAGCNICTCLPNKSKTLMHKNNVFIMSTHGMAHRQLLLTA